MRPTHGVTSEGAELARETGTALLRGDYSKLAETKLGEPSAIVAADEKDLLRCLTGSTEKVAIVREAVQRTIKRRTEAIMKRQFCGL